MDGRVRMKHSLSKLITTEAITTWRSRRGHIVTLLYERKIRITGSVPYIGYIEAYITCDIRNIC